MDPENCSSTSVGLATMATALERLDALERAMRNIEARVSRLETRASPPLERSVLAPSASPPLDRSVLAPSSHLYIGLDEPDGALLTDPPASGDPQGSVCASPNRWDMLNRRIEMLERTCEGVRSEVAAARRSDGAASSAEARDAAAAPLAGRLENAAVRLEQDLRGDPRQSLASRPPPPPGSAGGAAEEQRGSHSASLTVAV